MWLDTYNHMWLNIREQLLNQYVKTNIFHVNNMWLNAYNRMWLNIWCHLLNRKHENEYNPHKKDFIRYI